QELLRQRRRLAEPRPFPPLQISRQRLLASKHSLSPLAALRELALRLQKLSIVDERLRERGGLNHALKHRPCSFSLAALRQRIREQAGSAVIVISRILGKDMLQIVYSRRIVAQLQLAESAPVERIGRIRSCRDRAVIAPARPSVLAIFKIKISKLLIISRRRIVENQRLQSANATTPRKHLKAAPDHPDLRQHFHADVYESSNSAAKDDDPKPIGVRTAANEMQDGNSLKNNAVAKESVQSH